MIYQLFSFQIQTTKIVKENSNKITKIIIICDFHFDKLHTPKCQAPTTTHPATNGEELTATPATPITSPTIRKRAETQWRSGTWYRGTRSSLASSSGAASPSLPWSNRARIWIRPGSGCRVGNPQQCLDLLLECRWCSPGRTTSRRAGSTSWS